MSRGVRPNSHEPPAAVTPEVLALVGLGQDTRWKDDLTRELLEQLIIAARIGGFRRQTAMACQVRPDQLEYWLEEGMREDAPELMRELSARFLGLQAQQNLILTGVVSNAAQRGDWQAAVTMLSKRDPQWSGKMDMDKDLTPPERSQNERKALLVYSLKNPTGELAAAMREAGLLAAAPESPEPSEPSVSDTAQDE